MRPREYFTLVTKDPGPLPWTRRPWKHVRAEQVPVGSVVRDYRQPERGVIHLGGGGGCGWSEHSTTYAGFSGVARGTGCDDLLQEKRRAGRGEESQLRFATGATTIRRLDDGGTEATAAAAGEVAAVREQLDGGGRAFLVVGSMVAEGGWRFNTALVGRGRASQEWEAVEEEEDGARGPRLLGLQLVEVVRGGGPGRPFRPTVGYEYVLEPEAVDGVYTVVRES